MKLTQNRLKVFEFIKSLGTWVDINQIAHHTGVNTSVANRCLLAWTKEGLLVRNDMFQAYLYRLAEGYEQTPLGKELIAGLHILDMRSKIAS